MKFTLPKDAEALFYQLCLVFTIAPMLCHFDPTFFIKIETNNSDFAISGILSQQYSKIDY